MGYMYCHCSWAMSTMKILDDNDAVVGSAVKAETMLMTVATMNGEAMMKTMPCFYLCFLEIIHVA